MALTNKLSAIGDAIREKTGTIDLLKLDEMPTAIANIESGGGKFAPRYLYGGMISFQNYTGTELDHEVSTLDTSYFTKMENMFSNCKNLTSLDLSSFNTSNVTTMYNMFAYDEKLTTLNLSNFDTSKVTNMSSMIYYCRTLSTLIFNNDWDTSKVTTMYNMFAYDDKLKSLDLSSFDTSNVTNMSQMFVSCSSLQKLDIRNFTFDKVTSYSNMFSSVPANCLIIVKDEYAKTWVLARRSSLTNVKTLAEYQAEGGV
jgi:surface protein